MSAEPLNSQLLDILVCPQDKGKLWYFFEEEILYNPRLKLKYKIQDFIPVMLAEEAVVAEAEEHNRLMKKASELGIDKKTDKKT